MRSRQRASFISRAAGPSGPATKSWTSTTPTDSRILAATACFSSSEISARKVTNSPRPPASSTNQDATRLTDQILAHAVRHDLLVGHVRTDARALDPASVACSPPTCTKP